MAHLTLDIVRGWTDPEYRATLSSTARAQLPALPPGLVELKDAELGQRGAFDPLMLPPPVGGMDAGNELPQEECYDDLAGGVPFEDDPIAFGDTVVGIGEDSLAGF